MIIKHVMKKTFNRLPNQLKQSIKWKCFTQRNKSLLAELSRIDIVKSGSERIREKQTPFVVLKDGTVLYGKWPTQLEREIYALWRNTIIPTITEDNQGSNGCGLKVFVSPCYAPPDHAIFS